ncbi:hypothetical protein HYU96_00165 [Candidatus Daviesbacteria bacterium]|nr:hypothetical protein [Candidatus Daviesbacteria bacterium]
MIFLKNSTQSNQTREQTYRDLASLENKDAGYTVKYPINFNVLYTQDGVEFTPKQGPGRIILSVTNSIVNVNTEPEGADQSQLAMLNNAAQTIKDTFQFTESNSSDTTNNEGRFQNIYFDPKKY